MDLAQSEDVVSKLFQISKDANIRKEVKPAILENNFFFIKVLGISVLPQVTTHKCMIMLLTFQPLWTG